MPDSPFASLLLPHIAEMEAYTPIQPFEVLSRQFGRAPEQIVKLDANENPYGPAPAVREALASYPFTHIYPDPEQRELRAALADYVGVSAEHILSGSGADELIDLVCRLTLAPGDAIIDRPPTFGMYSFDAGLTGARVLQAWRRADFSVDVERICEWANGESANHASRSITHPFHAQASLSHLAEQPGRQLARSGGLWRDCSGCRCW